MPWFRQDDGMAEHPKTVQLIRKRKLIGLAAFGLHDLASINSARYLTDGHVPEMFVEDWCDRAGLRPKERGAVIAALVETGQWHEHPTDGWVIHDYTDYNPSREKVLADRERDAKRKAKGRAAQSATDDPGPEPESAWCPPGHDPDSPGNPDGVQPSRPDPSRTRPLEQQQERASAPPEILHPKLHEVVAILDDPTLGLNVEPASVDRILKANEDLDPIAAAHTVASWATEEDEPLRMRAANRLLGKAFEHQGRRQAQVRQLRTAANPRRQETHEERVARLEADAARALEAERHLEARS